MYFILKKKKDFNLFILIEILYLGDFDVNRYIFSRIHYFLTLETTNVRKQSRFKRTKRWKKKL